MEGPYRDLGSGFARLTGVEGVRRAPSRINYVEDALLELLRNAVDAGAQNIYVASSLRARRYRTLTVLDDGHGIPESYEDLIFEPGVTTRHVAAAAGSGLSLYHIKTAALNAAVLSHGNPTSVKATFDTRMLPERALQTGFTTARSNLPATIRGFLVERTSPDAIEVYYGSPAVVLATLTQNRIILKAKTTNAEPKKLRTKAEELGLRVSLRTVQRIVRGEIKPALPIEEIEEDEPGDVDESVEQETAVGSFAGGARLELGREEKSRIAAILGEAARTRYLEVGELEFTARSGEIVLRSRVYEPEEEYE